MAVECPFPESSPDMLPSVVQVLERDRLRWAALREVIANHFTGVRLLTPQGAMWRLSIKDWATGRAHRHMRPSALALVRDALGEGAEAIYREACRARGINP